MTVIAASLTTLESVQDSYRLDLRLGFPKAASREPSNGGLAILDYVRVWINIRILSSWKSIHQGRMMQIISCMQYTILSKNPADTDTDQSFGRHSPRGLFPLQVVPSSGLNDFVLLLSRAFPSLSTTDPCTEYLRRNTRIIYSLPSRPASRSSPFRLSYIKIEDKDVSLQTREAGNLQYFWPSARNTTVPVDIFRLVLRKNDVLSLNMISSGRNGSLPSNHVVEKRPGPHYVGSGWIRGTRCVLRAM